MKYIRYATYRDALEKREEYPACRFGCGKRFTTQKNRGWHHWARHGAPHPVQPGVWRSNSLDPTDAARAHRLS